MQEDVDGINDYTSYTEAYSLPMLSSSPPSASLRVHSMSCAPSKYELLLMSAIPAREGGEFLRVKLY